jgi:hypothetical protein
MNVRSLCFGLFWSLFDRLVHVCVKCWFVRLEGSSNLIFISVIWQLRWRYCEVFPLFAIAALVAAFSNRSGPVAKYPRIRATFS